MFNRSECIQQPQTPLTARPYNRLRGILQFDVKKIKSAFVLKVKKIHLCPLCSTSANSFAKKSSENFESSDRSFDEKMTSPDVVSISIQGCRAGKNPAYSPSGPGSSKIRSLSHYTSLTSCSNCCNRASALFSFLRAAMR